MAAAQQNFPRRFEGRSVLVTGAGTGFGAEIAVRAAEIGVRNVAIVRRGVEAGVPVLLNQAVTTLVNGLEQSWE